MRNLFILVIMLDIAGFSACEQKLKESQVPSIVKAAFERAYPNTKATWDKEGEGYEGEFKKDGREMSVIIDGSGNITETETMIAVTDLPIPISDYMNKYYSGMKIEEAAKIIKASGDVNYEAEIKEKDIVFDANGNFLKEEKE